MVFLDMRVVRFASVSVFVSDSSRDAIVGSPSHRISRSNSSFSVRWFLTRSETVPSRSKLSQNVTKCNNQFHLAWIVSKSNNQFLPSWITLNELFQNVQYIYQEMVSCDSVKGHSTNFVVEIFFEVKNAFA